MSGAELALPAGSVVTVGSFDGMHRGHQALLRELHARAARLGAAPVVVTFEPHPATVIAPARSCARLTLAVERQEVLAELGSGYLLVLRFDAALAGLSAQQFVQEVLLGRCRMRELVIGVNHRFGHGGAGDSLTLPPLGRRLGFAVSVVAPVADEQGEVISSTRIRAALAAGELARVAQWLGRPYRFTARVTPGAGRGQTIGMPTINLAEPPREKALPPDGVYAARVEWGGGTAGAMVNQGPRPTVGDLSRSIEAHLFDFSENLYGRTVRLEWVERLRDIQRFPSLDALRAQLALDRDRALEALRRFPETSTTRPIAAR
ncbi:MAG TPA: riboflavin biosynthesis protein RibF [Gemmatimonadales bacterium]|jgi:riboflavin kinase/FMN adenylyltransferase|nr:riboflavin biosynthesis protein RibF [Gemmatimonadales bacterium]